MPNTQQVAPANTLPATTQQSASAVSFSLGATEGQAFIETALLRPVPRRVRVSRKMRKARLLAWNVIGGLALGALYLSLASYELSFFGAMLLIAVGHLGAATFEREEKRVYQSRLLRDGIAVTGAITPDVFTPDLTYLLNPFIRHRGETINIRYRFQTVEGKALTRTLPLKPSVARRFTPGQKLTILYNPTRLHENYPYLLITDAEVE